MTAAALAALEGEFDRLAAEGRRVDFWWRDDDAVAATPALDRLLAIAGGTRCPLALATIPACIELSLPERLREGDGVTILVHGWRHANHAGPGAKKAEFDSARPLADAVADASSALDAAARAFGPRLLPVFVPPWNRIAPGVAARLSGLGYGGLSCFGEATSGSDFIRVDTHLDPVDWHGTRSLAAPEALVAMIRRALARGTDTIGLLTHHLMFDEALWSFTAGMAALAGRHPALRPLGLADLLAAAAPRLESASA